MLQTVDSSVSRSEQYWTDDELLECCSVVPEAPNVMTFSFVAPSGARFRYLPGQFITVELPVPSGTVWRTYTISSSPSRPMSISITVKAQEGSIGTRWMLDHLRPGMKIKASGPAGAFALPEDGKSKYLFISAGSGITPSLSMTTYLFDRATDIDVVLVNCAQRPQDIIARDTLEAMAARVPAIKLHFVVEQDDPFQVWTGYRGRLNQLMIGLMAGDYLEREIYCCGPEPFMDAVREMLIDLGYDMACYHQESFNAPTEAEADVEGLQEGDVVPDDNITAEVTFTKSGVKGQCSETDSVLAVAKAQGIVIPSGCTFGVCGTCKVRKLSGEVNMVHNGGISQKDIDEGYILACCSKPIGQVEVEV